MSKILKCLIGLWVFTTIISCASQVKTHVGPVLDTVIAEGEKAVNERDKILVQLLVNLKGFEGVISADELFVPFEKEPSEWDQKQVEKVKKWVKRYEREPGKAADLRKIIDIIRMVHISSSLLIFF